MFAKQVAEKFLRLNDGKISVSVDWGEFNNRELNTAGNIQVTLIPGWNTSSICSGEALIQYRGISRTTALGSTGS
jgi:hypothetical protein